MQTNLFTLLTIIGASFSLIAAVMAYLITYTEYEKHYADNKKKARLLSLESAAFVFALFLVVSIAAAFYFGGPAFAGKSSG